MTVPLYEYDIDEKSIVFDLGGYRGEWAWKVLKKYNPMIHIFEPVEANAQFLGKRFKDFDNVKIYNAGIFVETGPRPIIEDGLSSRFTSYSESSAYCLNAARFFTDKIDLVKMNIEGDEFQVLNYLVFINLLKNVKALQVQFHHWVTDSEEKKKTLYRSFRNIGWKPVVQNPHWEYWK